MSLDHDRFAMLYIIKNNYVAYGIFWVQAASSIGYWAVSSDTHG